MRLTFLKPESRSIINFLLCLVFLYTLLMPACYSGFHFPPGLGGNPTNNSTGGGTTAPMLQSFQKTFMSHSYLSGGNTSELANFEAQVDEAVLGGYTGMVMWDSSLSYVQNAGWDSSTQKQAIQYALSKGLTIVPEIIPFGYSYEMLQSNPNFAEGQRVVGSTFRVVAGGPTGLELQFQNSLPSLVNTGFENGTTGWFSWGDPRTQIDTTTAYAGSASGIIEPGNGNARFVQTFNVIPWRLYHIQFFLKTSGIAGGDALMAEVMDPGTGVVRLQEYPSYQSTQTWTEVDYTFNSMTSTQLMLLVGNWGGMSGTAWVDNLTVTETALVNLVIRGGTPINIYDPSNPSTVYVDGTDVTAIADPGSGHAGGTIGNFDYYHSPPTVTVPSGSRLMAGQTVAIDHYTVIPIGSTMEVGACLTEQAVLNWVQSNFQAVSQLFPAGTSYLLGYDEMRQMNSCALCKSKNMTAGQLLAWNVQQVIGIMRAIKPNVQVFFWNDMFDPYHNAVNNYYHVEGTIAGSWAGLTPDATTLDWNLGQLTKSLNFFAGLDPNYPGLPQRNSIIAGFYDNSNPEQEAVTEVNESKGIPGVIGQNYTTWTDDYGNDMILYIDGMNQAWGF